MNSEHKKPSKAETVSSVQHLTEEINEKKAKYRQLAIRSEEIQKELTKLVDEQDDVEKAKHTLERQIEKLTKKREALD